MSQEYVQIDSAIRMLKDDDSSVRREVVENLGRSGSLEAVQLISQALKDDSKGVQQVAADVLINIGGEEVVRYVIPHLYDEKASVRSLAIEVLKSVGDDGLQMILDLIKDKDPDVRKFAADILATVGDEEVIGPMVSLLDDPNPNVRAAAVETLGKKGDVRAIEPLIGLLGDEEWVRFSVVDALGNIGDKKVIPYLLNKLRETGVVQYGGIEALGNFKDAGIVPELLNLMNEADKELRKLSMMSLLEISEGEEHIVKEKVGEKRFLHHLMDASRDPDTEVKRYVLKGLGVVDDPIATGIILRVAAETDPDDEEAMHEVKEALASIKSPDPLLTFLGNMNLAKVGEKEHLLIEIVVDALGKVGDSNTAISLENILFDVEEQVRVFILKAIGEIGYGGCLDTVIKGLKESNGDVRKAAAIALGDMKAETGVEPLTHLLETEKFPDVVEAVINSLVSIGGKSILEPMARLIEHEESSVRERAAVALGLLEMPEGTEMLLRVLKDNDWRIRKSALNSLRNLDYADDISLILPALKDENDQVRGAAVALLGNYDERALSPLIGTLEDESMWVRFRAAETLGKIGGDEVINALIDMVQRDEGPGRVAAVKALGTLKDERGVDYIQQLVNHEDDILRDVATKALHEIEGAIH